MATVLGPLETMSCSVQLEGGTLMFMSPELLQPSVFGLKVSLPTPEGDIYAFGLVTFQVCEQGRGYQPFAYIVQVLTGEIPFRGLRPMELGYKVVQGLRPAKPDNASAIGFSDSLWGFVQRCWNGDAKFRPKVGEVVTQFGREAANWRGLMPPCTRAEIVASNSEELSDTIEHCKFDLSILP